MYILLFISFFFLLYAYILYPYYLKKKVTSIRSFSGYTLQDNLPFVHIVIPVCNEEKVIKAKLNSILDSQYPINKMAIYIGLDNCTDATKSIITSTFTQSNIQLKEFTQRQGKPAVLNQLIASIPSASESILILTDANVIFTPSTIFELVKYFKDEKIGLVDACIQSKNSNNNKEADYLSYETQIKKHESQLYGIILGPSGGCYAIRRSLFSAIPPNFLVDDFYIGFSIISKGWNAILNIDAICYEDLYTSWKQEFNRKIRIATGNFQNLMHFKKYAFQPFSKIGFIFLSHKVIRWKTPFLLLIIYYIFLLKYTLFILIVTFFLPIIDFFLFIFKLEFKPLRQLHYFIFMNLAVLIGFFKYIKGVKSNVWKPTTRE